MIKRKSTAAPHSEASLGAGIAAGIIELGSPSECRVRLTSGELVRAVLAPGVEPALALDCITHKRIVILAGGGEAPLILGALQTGITPQIDTNGNLHLRARQVYLEADEQLELRAGQTGEPQTALKLDRNGKIRLRGERMLMNVTANLRVHSALVELP